MSEPANIASLDTVQSIIDGAVDVGVHIQRASDFERPSMQEVDTEQAEKQFQRIEEMILRDSN